MINGRSTNKSQKQKISKYLIVIKKKPTLQKIKSLKMKNLKILCNLQF